MTDLHTAQLIFTSWQLEPTRDWGRAPSSLPHLLHNQPLFSFDALPERLDPHPPQQYLPAAMDPWEMRLRLSARTDFAAENSSAVFCSLLGVRRFEAGLSTQMVAMTRSTIVGLPILKRLT